MDFGKRIKNIRLENNLTQENMAKKLNVSRQAISNWENNKNLPDLEMIIIIAQMFPLSLDQLILGEGYNMDNITEKLIKDGSEGRRSRRNLIMVSIGTILLIIGIGLILIKGLTVEYIDSNGILHENFFLLPMGFISIFCGLLTFIIAGVKNIFLKRKED